MANKIIIIITIHVHVHACMLRTRCGGSVLTHTVRWVCKLEWPIRIRHRWLGHADWLLPSKCDIKITSWSRYGLWIYSVSLLVSFCRFFCQIFSWCCFKGSRWRCHTIKINSMCLECLSWFWKVEKKGRIWSRVWQKLVKTASYTDNISLVS